MFFNQLPTGNGMMPQGPMQSLPNTPPNPNVGQNLIATLAQLIATHPDEGQKQRLLASLFQPTYREGSGAGIKDQLDRYYGLTPVSAGSSDMEEGAMTPHTVLRPIAMGTGRTSIDHSDYPWTSKPDNKGGKPQKGKS